MKPSDTLDLAAIGVGAQGRLLVTECVKIPGVRVQAVCDIWPHHRTWVANRLGKYKHFVRQYEDYGEMLATEKDLDAVLVASPDWMHAEHTIAALEAGLHVYCEKEMSNSIAAARRMVQTARRTGKLLQIGHQRRSNPRYRMALEWIDKHKVCGRITHVMGQWNRRRYLDRAIPDKNGLDEATLGRYGYASMRELLNWRQYRKFSQGPLADLGSHQVDVFHWFLHARPKSVMAWGNAENYRGIEWYDDVLAVYEWDYTWQGETRTVGGHYQVCSTSSHGDYAETFLGTDGTLAISEMHCKGGVWREWEAPSGGWLESRASRPRAAAAKPSAKAPAGAGAEAVAVGPSPEPFAASRYPPVPVPRDAKTLHMPHLENFFDAVRGKAKLNCPGESGYETCVSILRANEAIEAGRKIGFRDGDFEA